MKVLYSLFGFCSISLLIIGCNKGVTTFYSLDKLDKNRIHILEQEIKSIHYICGSYVGEICKNDKGDNQKVRVVLLNDSTYDLYCESIEGNKKTERIKGSYSYDQDTLTLYTAMHNQRFLIKDKSLHYLSDSITENKNTKPTNNILYKN